MGTDFSPIWDPAISWASALRQFGACEITVVHAVASVEPHEVRALERDLQRRLKERSDAAETQVVVKNEAESAGRCLARLASTERADLLILGSRQRTGFDRMWHGTVAGEALSCAHTNVACVPALAPAEQRAQPIPEIRSVLAATDFSKIGNAAVAHAYALVASGGVVHLVHVVRPRRFESRFALPSNLTFTVDTAPEHHLAMQLVALVPRDAETRGIESRMTIVENRDVVEGICGTANQLNVDAICLGSRGRSTLADAVVGSVARGVANRAGVPVLLVPFAREA